MPPRWLSLAIVVFWLAATGWLFVRDLWPRLRPGQPPPYEIDLADETQQVEHGLPQRKPATFWIVFRNGEEILTAFTSVEHHERPDDAFTFQADFRPYFRPLEAGPDGPAPAPASLIKKIERLRSRYRVSRQGELLAFDMTFRVIVGLAGLDTELRGQITGTVRDGQLRAHVQASGSLGGRQLEHDLAPVAVSRRGSVLLPLHPLNRIRGLRPGQTWDQPVVDPLGDALSASFPLPTGQTAGDRTLRATVLPETQPLPRTPRGAHPPAWLVKETPPDCLVIEYDDEGRSRTWVRASDGLVLCQECTVLGDRWVMRRDSLK
jgi:hypothetical protein